jgi:hypothetical protein
MSANPWEPSPAQEAIWEKQNEILDQARELIRAGKSRTDARKLVEHVEPFVARCQANDRIDEVVDDELAKTGERTCNYCDARFKIGGMCPDCLDERRLIARRLADDLRELADACEQAAEGNEAARKLLRDATSSDQRALIVGKGKVEELIHPNEDN